MAVPQKRKRRRNKKQKGKVKKEEGAVPWWFHAGFMPSCAIYGGLSSDVFPRITIFMLLSFGNTIGGPHRRTTKEEKGGGAGDTRLHAVLVSCAGFMPWFHGWFHVGFMSGFMSDSFGSGFMLVSCRVSLNTGFRYPIKKFTHIYIYIYRTFGLRDKGNKSKSIDR